MKLTNQNVLITGAAHGIGRAIALLFAKEGANIVIHCHHLDKDAKSLQKAVQKLGRKALVIEADLQKYSEIKRMIVEAIKSFKQIDILVNNAGKYPENGFFESTEENFDLIMNTNLKSQYFCSQLLAKKMLKQKASQIVNISSVAGIYPRKSSFEYALSKAAIIHFTKCLSLLLAPKVRVNCIAPSYTWSNFMSFMKDPQKVKEKMKLVPTGQFNTPEEIAEAALYLASSCARNITGQVLIIDGGRGSTVN